MNSDWPLKELVQIADEVTVGYVGPMASEYVESGIPFLRSLNIEQFRINKNDLKYVTPEFHKRIKKSSLQPGDVAIVRTGKPGTCAVIPDWLQDANCSDLVIVRCGKEIRPHFLCYWVNSIASHHIDSHTVGAVQQHFNVGAAKIMKVAVPSLPKQDQVVELLGGLDNRIALLRETNTTLEAVSQALFKSWFVDFDPVHAKQQGREPEGMDADTAALFPDSFEESELGLVPKEWLVGVLGEILVESTKRVGNVNALVLSAVQSGELVKSSEHFTKKVHSEDISKYKAVSKYAFAYNPSRINIGSIGINEFDSIGAVSPVYVVATPKSKEHGYFLWHQIKTLNTQEWIKILCSGTVRQSLSFKDFSSIPIIIPPHEILFSFLNIRDTLYGSVNANLERINVLTELRDTLLPRLISGQLRLPEALDTDA